MEYREFKIYNTIKIMQGLTCCLHMYNEDFIWKGVFYPSVGLTPSSKNYHVDHSNHKTATYALVTSTACVSPPVPEHCFVLLHALQSTMNTLRTSHWTRTLVWFLQKYKKKRIILCQSVAHSTNSAKFRLFLITQLAESYNISSPFQNNELLILFYSPLNCQVK